MSQRDFELQLERGRMGERMILGEYQRHGWGVIPSYDYSGQGDNKAPKLAFAHRGLPVPDGDICKDGVRVWIEVKTFYHSPWNRSHKSWRHGIKRRLRDAYLEVQRETGAPVYLCVLEVCSGVALVARLDRIEWHPCQCRPNCESPWCAVYFERHRMQLLRHFSNEEMVEIRAAWGEAPPSFRKDAQDGNAPGPIDTFGPPRWAGAEL